MQPDIKGLEEQLRKVLSKERFSHTLGVKQTAERLAVRWGADPSRAGLAGLLHDCARGMSGQQLVDSAETMKLDLSEFERRNPVLIHAPLGALLAEKTYGVTDPGVLKAIRYHTTACGDMDILCKVVYLADYISPERNFPGVEEIRRWSDRDLRRALISATRSSLGYLLGREFGIHPNTIDFWNTLVK